MHALNNTFVVCIYTCHLRMHIRTSYACPMVFDVSSMSRFVTITILHEASAKLCLFQQCASDVNDLAYVTGSGLKIDRPESKPA